MGLPLFGGKVLEAEGDVVRILRGAVQQKPRGEAPRQHQRPHRHAHYSGVALSPQRPGAKRVHDGQEAVHADAREEEDAAVHVGVEQRDGDFAEWRAEGPVLVYEVEDPQGQREDEQQVGHHQVHHVGGGLVPQFKGAGEDVHGHDVGDEPDHEHDAEDRAVQGVLEVIILGAV